MRKVLCIFFLGLMHILSAQNIPNNRVVDWTRAGLRDTSTLDFITIDALANGFAGDGLTNNDSVLNKQIEDAQGKGLILKFGEGIFLFSRSIKLGSNVVLRGLGPAKTKLILNYKGTGHGILVNGSLGTEQSFLEEQANLNSKMLKVKNASLFKVGDWLRVYQNDTDLVTSNWSRTYIGQLVKISSIAGNELYLESGLRMEYPLNRSPYVRKVNMAQNTGIECLSIERQDNSAPQQTSNILFNYAANCWVSGIESAKCNFAHVELEKSSNILVERSYFHHGHEYGGNGRAYGVMAHLVSGENRIENNIFEHLRHSMIVQAGANGNVFSYNYSHDPFWESGNPLTPANSAGDMVLHGNYTYANLFEQNICQNIVIDNSHGPNGPYNTFVRNRAESYGIFFSATNSPSQNFIANDVTNNLFPYSLVNYTILGDNHFLYGNYNKGSLTPVGTDSARKESFAYTKRPDFINPSQWLGIGAPNTPDSIKVSAYDRFKQAKIFAGCCGQKPLKAKVIDEEEASIVLNPNTSELVVKATSIITHVKVFSMDGRMVCEVLPQERQTKIAMPYVKKGVLVVWIELQTGQNFSQKVMAGF